MRRRLRSLIRGGVCLLLAASLTLPVLGDTVIFRHAAPVSTGSPRIALTFDDGPHPVLTAEILDLLEHYGAHATFFCVGQNAAEHPELIRRELAEGHEVGNHTFTHPDLNAIGERELLSQLQKTDGVLFDIAGSHPLLFRPPTGLCNRTVMTAAAQMGYSLVLWSVDTRDWSVHTSLSHIVNEVKTKVQDGAVILFHDYSCRHDRATLHALEELIPYLQSRGYTFCTVSELMTPQNAG